jgi:hypothetical protein
MNTVCFVNEPAHEEINMNRVARREQASSLARQEEAKWTTKQVLAACLWSALFGLGCGYGWLLLQVGTAICR